MLPIEHNAYCYEVRPKVVLEGRETSVRIRPLDYHAAFEEGRTYTIRVVPLTSDTGSPSRPPVFETRAVCTDGVLCFTHAFQGEQEHSIRVYLENEEKMRLKTSVYALKPDLFERRPFLGDFHVHSCFSDGTESPEFVAAMYRQAGYDFIAITDHGRRDSSLRAIEAYRGIPMDFCIYPGEEAHPPYCPVHIVNFGGDFSVNETFLTKIDGCPWGNPGRPEWMERVKKRQASIREVYPNIDPYVHAACLETIDSIREGGGMAILCHPFWISDVHNVTNEFVELYLRNGLVDAFELTGGMTNHENMMQIAFYHQLRSEGCEIPVVGSSDTHGTIDHIYFEYTKTMVLARSNSRDDIIEAVRGQYSVAMDEYRGQEPRYYSSYRMVSYAMFLYEQYFPLYQELCHEEGRLMRRFVAGDVQAREELARLHGRTDMYRESFFAQYGSDGI